MTGAHDESVADDLRATADSIAQEAERLAEIERAKVELAPSSPLVEELSAQALSLAADIHRKSSTERALAAEAAENAEPPTH